MRIALLLTLALACARRGEIPKVETAAPAEQTAPTPATTPSGPPAPIRTDRSSYVLTNGPRGPEVTIVATLRAPAGQALYLVNCNGHSVPTLQRKVGDAWEYALVVMSSACLSPPIVIPPGGEHTARILVDQHAGSVQRDRPLVSGTYRAVWTGVLTSYDTNKEGFGPELPLEQRISAPFTIQVPPLTQ